MFYVFYNVELLLKNKKYNQAYELLHSHRKSATRYKMLIDTKNEVFDCLFSLKINDLITNGLDVNLCVFISKSMFYDTLLFINSLNSLIECLHKCTTLTINITENLNYTIIKIFCSDNASIDETKILNAIKNISKSYEIRYTIGGSIKKSIKILIKRDISYEEV